MALFDTELSESAWVVAPRLLGSELIRELDGQQVISRIVETEAYDQTDAASHSYRGQTPRTAVMFGPPGFAYVYFTYGMHYCMNIVTGPAGVGSAVLIRAIEPLEGVAVLRRYREGIEDTLQLTNGPAKLCKALCIDKQLNGHDLRSSPLQLRLRPPFPQSHIAITSRIGISREKERLGRFFIQDNPYVSK